MVLRGLSVHVRNVQARVRTLIETESALAAVRAATRTRHERLDASGWLDGATATLAAYAAHLADVAALYDDAERALAPFETELRAAGFAPHERRKSAGLAAERALLAERGFRVIPQPAAFPEIADLAAATGCLYVLEGSTLGGVLIARRIAEQLHWESSFYGVYGERTAAMWRAFTAAFALLGARLDRAALAGAAVAVFDAYAERVGHLEPLTGC